MTDLKFKILQELYKTTRRELDHTEIYKLNLAPVIDVKKAIDDLLNDGLIKHISGSTILRLTKSGIDAYEQAAQEREKEEQTNRRHKEAMKQNLRSAIWGSIAGSIAGLITSLLFWLITHQFD